MIEQREEFLHATKHFFQKSVPLKSEPVKA